MKPIPADLLDKLDMRAALDAEIDSKRNLLPREPWLDPVAKKRDEVAQWAEAQAKAGSGLAENVVVNARKAGHGVRPVAVSGVAERIIYRAIVDYIAGPLDLPNRTATEYAAVVAAPLIYARSQAANKRSITDAGYKYVVEADISSFYQYIDHNILERELQIQTSAVEWPAVLRDFLREVEGRTFGLPQILDASDSLSEIYIRMVERDLARQGLLVWRYNDDFRILVQEYGDALSALESLSHSARSVGLTLNDSKTRTPGILPYFWKSILRRFTDTGKDFNPDDADIAIDVSEYEDEAEVSLQEAQQTLAKIDSTNPGDRIDLKNLTPTGLRGIRTAISNLTRIESDAGIPYVVRLFFFVPSLAPRLCQYMLAIASINRDATERTVGELIANPNSSDWQQLWLLRVGRDTASLGGDRDKIEWVKRLASGRRSSVLLAEASLALAELGDAQVSELDAALRVEPAALAPWYVMAIASLDKANSTPASKQAVNSLRKSNPLNAALVDL